MLPPFAEMVTRHRAGRAPDPYQPRGGTRSDWEISSSEVVGPVAYAPQRSETRADRDRTPTETGAAFYGDDPQIDVRAGDRLARQDGTIWTVTGDPERWDARATGWPGGIVIPVERVTEGT